MRRYVLLLNRCPAVCEHGIDCRPDTVRADLLAPGDPPGRQRAARSQHLREECFLREVPQVERYQEIGQTILRASAKWVVRRIRRDLSGCVRRYQLGLFAQEVDEQPDRLAPDLKPPEDDLVLGESLFGSDPGERAVLDPIPQEPRAWIGCRNSSRAEAGDPGDKNRGVDYAPRPS